MSERRLEIGGLQASINLIFAFGSGKHPRVRTNAKIAH